MADAQHAVSAAHSQASLDRIALAACRKESEVLQAKNATLVASSRTQLQEINFLRMRCDALAADCELAREEISTRDRKIVKLQSLITTQIAQQERPGIGGGDSRSCADKNAFPRPKMLRSVRTKMTRFRGLWYSVVWLLESGGFLESVIF
ncbi:hypothetical protein B0H14DRAFT_2574557 [Mycena olivaceomarginata]|nr:hypothetical protein B0H14DRAFT_2574557 [Mycena olivaceomarginata]